jgi:hypothetical protein
MNRAALDTAENLADARTFLQCRLLGRDKNPFGLTFGAKALQLTG